MRSPIRSSAVAAIAAAFAVLALPASAHEDREVRGVEMVVGWATEPAVAGYLNAVQVTVRDGGAGLTGASLTARVGFGEEQSEELRLEPVFGAPGEYHATLVPTRPGQYVFHITGRIRGRPVDERFRSGANTFDDVQDASEMEFPVRDPSRGELAQRVERLGPRIDRLNTQLAARAEDASSKATTAMVLGGVALLLGLFRLLGLAALGVGLRRSKTSS